LIDEEIAQAKAGNEAYIGIKINGFTDKELIDKMIEASQAGVKIDLLVRGICCIVGGVPGLTQNIRVTSIVGRYLEHSRVYIFGTDERRRLYIGSADFMTRNTNYRVEVCTPIYDPEIRHQIESMFTFQMSDNVKARRQQPDGSYVYASNDLPTLNSQEYFYDAAYEGDWQIDRPQKTMKPVLRNSVKTSKETDSVDNSQEQPTTKHRFSGIRFQRKSAMSSGK
jgi:polyphosphate kinase